MAHGLRGRLSLSRAALLAAKHSSTARIQLCVRTVRIVLSFVVGIYAVSAAHSQNDFTRIYGPEDHAVPTPAFVGTVGRQDTSAIEEITEYRAAVGATSWSGFQASGTLTDGSGTSNQATLTILGSDKFRLDVTTPDGVESTRIGGGFGSIRRAANGRVTAIPPVTARGGLIAFSRLLGASIPDSTTTIADRGLIQLDGAAFHRITIESPVFPSRTSTAQVIPNRDLNITDLYFDPTTHLLIKSASSVQVSSSDAERYTIVVTYGDYQTVGNVLVPLTFVRTINGQPEWALQLSNPNLQPSVDASYFHF